MKSMSIGEALAVRDLPPVFTVGAGNSASGITEGSILNAQSATALVINGIVPSDWMCFAGYGTNPNANYLISEAEGMASVSLAMFDDHNFHRPTELFVEDKSYDTIGNFENFAPTIKELNAEALTVVAAQYHVDRAAEIARKILGIEIVPVYSCGVNSLKAIVKELALKSLYTVTTAPFPSGSPTAALGARAYRNVVRLPKRVATSVVKSERYADS